MRAVSPSFQIKMVAVFLCVSISAYVLSSLVLTLLNSRFAPVQPRPLVQIVEAKRPLRGKLPVDHYRSIWENNIFFTSAGDPPPLSDSVQVDQLNLTSLNCSLVGTMVQEAGDGWAVIMDNDDNRQDMVMVGSNFKGARVVRILKDKVVLNWNGKDELLLMDMEERPETASATPVSRVPGRGQVLTYNISRSLVQQSLGDLTSVMSKVRVEPHFAGGKADGFRLSQIQSGSVLTSVGFQSGDIIKNVNGRKVATVEDAMRLYESMKGSSFFRIGIERNNVPNTIQIRVR